MKVLHLVPTLRWSGGIETYLFGMLPMLEADGHPQVVAYGEGDPSLVQVAYRVPTLGRLRTGRDRKDCDVLDRIVQGEQPDVVHLHNVNNVALIAACLDRLPTFATAHGYHYLCPATDFYRERSQTICERSCGPMCFAVTLGHRCLSLRPRHTLGQYDRSRWTLRNAHRFAGIIAPSCYARERYVRAGFPADRVTVLPYYCPLEPEPAPPPDAPTLLFVGRMCSYKGYEYFVRALGQLPPPVRGIMVGDFTAQTEQQVRRLAAESGCGERLELRGWVDRDGVAPLMREATALVFPSIWPETLGIVGLEALACGVPVIACDVGGVREWLIEGETGYLVPPKDPAAIALAADKILRSSETRAALGARGVELMNERFSPAKHRARLLALYAKSYGARMPATS